MMENSPQCQTQTMIWHKRQLRPASPFPATPHQTHEHASAARTKDIVENLEDRLAGRDGGFKILNAEEESQEVEEAEHGRH